MENEMAMQMSFLVTLVISAGLLFFLAKILLGIMRQRWAKYRIGKIDMDNYKIVATKNGLPTMLQNIKNKNNIIYI